MFDTIIQISWQASVLVTLILAAQSIMGRRLAPRWRCALWGLLLIRLAMPVLPQSRMSLFGLLENEIDQPASPRFSFGYSGDSPGAPQRPLAEPSKSMQTVPSGFQWDWRVVTIAAWLGGMTFMLARLVITNILFSRSLRQSGKTPDSNVVEQLNFCCRHLRIRSTPPIIESRCVAAPALYGAFRPSVLLPAGLNARLTPSELRFVLFHELVHLKRRDVLVGWIMSLFNIVHWFNPLLWLAAARFRADRELACDAAVLKLSSASDRADYGKAILKVVEGLRIGSPIPCAVGIVHDRRSIHRRIVAISQPFPATARWSIVPSALFLAIGCSTLTSAPKSAATLKPLKQTATVYAADEFAPLALDQNGCPIFPITQPASTQPALDPSTPQITLACHFLTGDTSLDPRKWIKDEGFEHWPEHLDSQQVDSLLRSVQKDKNSKTLMMPRLPQLTLFDRQSSYAAVSTDTAYLADCTQTPEGADPIIKVVSSGVLLEVKTTMAADRQTVNCQLHPFVWQLRNLTAKPWPQSQPGKTIMLQVPTVDSVSIRTAADIPDGKTLVLRAPLQARRDGEEIGQSKSIVMLITPSIVRPQ